jgi:hypothetical protein
MWRSALNIESEIMIRNWDEYEAAMNAGDYDVVRRGIVMQTSDELVNLRMLFERDARAVPSPSPSPEGATLAAKPPPPEKIVVESESPIYFASSYSLVKPYVSGFDSNVLDVPSLKKTRMDTNWTHP